MCGWVVEETKEKEGMRDDVKRVLAEGLLGVCWGEGRGGPVRRVVWL